MHRTITENRWEEKGCFWRLVGVQGGEARGARGDRKKEEGISGQSQ